MKELITIIILMLGAWSIQGQVSLERQAIGSGGDYHSGPVLQISHTVGEVAITSQLLVDIQITEGFQQYLSVSSVCLGDYNNDGMRNTSDLLILLGGFSCTSSCPTDLNGDDMTNTSDLLIFLGLFGTPCP
jgi:hypothetical protein